MRSLLCLFVLLVGCAAPIDKVELGERIFHDTTLSEPMGQSCASCHDAGVGFADPYGRAVSQGAVEGLFSARNSPTVAYAAFVPPLAWDSVEGLYVGGLFWDGRSNDLAAQAGEPFLDPNEMANPSRAAVVEKVRKAPYFSDFVRLYGESSNADTVYKWICQTLAEYQASARVNLFSSKYDRGALGERERQGLELFNGKGKCASCHVTTPDPRSGKVLFTDHTYDNLGLFRNANNVFSADTVDLGLGAVVRSQAEHGKFRVPTLRNVALTAPYGHNGAFATLQEIVHFYNVRDVSDKFPAAEYPETVNADEMGNLGLTDEEERLIVEFLHTLTDLQ